MTIVTHPTDNNHSSSPFTLLFCAFIRLIIPTMLPLKNYQGEVPVCGVFCGGCPEFKREENPCSGVSLEKDRCSTCHYDQCAKSKGLSYCHECEEYPCNQFKYFSQRWNKHGQNFIENQALLKEEGPAHFLQVFNERAAAQLNSRIPNQKIKAKTLSCAGCPHCNLRNC